MIKTPGQRSVFGLSALAAFFIFLVLWRLDFPKPMVDDLFYCGAGLNLAQGGDFSNPLLARQEFPNHYFYVYPPLHSYAIAAWMRTFGVNASSLTAFQMLMYFITAVGTIAVLRRRGAPVWLEYLVPFGVTASFLCIGLRPEPFGVALTMAGFAFLECGRKHWPAIFAGFLLMFMGGSAAPRVTLFTAALVLFSALELWRDRVARGLKMWTPFLFCLCAFLAAGLLLLWQIEFRAGQFWETFHFHSLGLQVKPLRFLISLLQFFADNPLLGKATWLVLFLVATFGFFARQQRLTEPVRAAIFLAVAFPVVSFVGLLGFGTIWFAILMVFLLAGSVLPHTPRPWVYFLNGTLATFLLAANAGRMIEAYGIVRGRVSRDPGEQIQLAKEMRPTTEHPLLIDPATARYVFDYRVPDGCLDFNFAARFPDEGYIQTIPPRDGDVLLLGPASVRFIKEFVILDRPIPQWRPWEIRDVALDKYPRRPFVLTAEDCKARWTGPQTE